MTNRFVKFLSVMAPPEPPQYKMLGFLALIAFFGGGVRALNERKPDVAGWALVGYLLTAGATSALAGLATTSLCLHWFGTNAVYLLIAMAAVSGWMGVVIMEQLGAIALKRLQRKLEGGDGGSER